MALGIELSEPALTLLQRSLQRPGHGYGVELAPQPGTAARPFN